MKTRSRVRTAARTGCAGRSGPGATTMPLVIFSRARLGLNPSVNAVATIIVVVVAVGVVLASWMIARAERRRALEMSAANRA